MLKKEIVFIESPQTNIIVMHQIYLGNTYPTYIEYGGYIARLNDITSKGSARYVIDLNDQL